MERGVLDGDAGIGSCVRVSMICSINPASQHQTADLTEGSSYNLCAAHFQSIFAP